MTQETIARLQPMSAPSLPRRLLQCAMDHMRAYDACRTDADDARERVMQAGEAAIAKILAEHKRALLGEALDALLEPVGQITAEYFAEVKALCQPPCQKPVKPTETPL